MTQSPNPQLDLTLTRVIHAPRSVVWDAWTDPASFEQWWIPEPAKCKVISMDMRPGGALVTHMSESGGHFEPHMNASYLAIDPLERIVFTDALVAGWRPAERPFMTAIITFGDHPAGTNYAAHVMHKSRADRDAHEAMGFYDGWTTVAAQLARLAEARASRR